MKRLSITIALLLMQPLAAAAGHPATLGERDIDRGYEWVAASRVLEKDGAARAIRLPRELRKSLEWQVSRSAVDHETEAGQVPARVHCAPIRTVRTPPIGESDGRLSTVLLLSDVAVSATLEDAIPGFDYLGNPMVLFALSDVAPLHDRSSIPEYVLVPFDRIVVAGRVFCSVNQMANFWSQQDPRR